MKIQGTNHPTPPPPPAPAKLALVNQELHRPETSLQPTPGNGPGYGSNPALATGKPREVGQGSGVDEVV
ncbi:MAG: hypothetical protein FJZ01_22410 [Candidatus Sericytochromatia bacterium]|nr:hypothetical protein [Candidatus Tanganyikabacteria bacterium]